MDQIGGGEAFDNDNNAYSPIQVAGNILQ